VFVRAQLLYRTPSSATRQLSGTRTVVGRFVGHQEVDDCPFLEASPLKMWDDVDEAIARGHGRARSRCRRPAPTTLDTIYSAGEVPAPEARPWPPT
jgi:hypothetical protein